MAGFASSSGGETLEIEVTYFANGLASLLVTHGGCWGGPYWTNKESVHFDLVSGREFDPFSVYGIPSIGWVDGACARSEDWALSAATTTGQVVVYPDGVGAIFYMSLGSKSGVVRVYSGEPTVSLERDFNGSGTGASVPTEQLLV